MNSTLSEARIKYEIFVSYHSEMAKKDKKFADLIQEKTTWRTFLASSDTNDTEKKMHDALYHSRLFVIFNQEHTVNLMPIFTKIGLCSSAGSHLKSLKTFR